MNLVLLAAVLQTAQPVNVDCGRQLFVDDYLVETPHGVVRYWNHPVKDDSPVVWPGDGAGVGVMDGGGEVL